MKQRLVIFFAMYEEKMREENSRRENNTLQDIYMNAPLPNSKLNFNKLYANIFGIQQCKFAGGRNRY